MLLHVHRMDKINEDCGVGGEAYLRITHYALRHYALTHYEKHYLQSGNSPTMIGEDTNSNTPQHVDGPLISTSHSIGYGLSAVAEPRHAIPYL